MASPARAYCSSACAQQRRRVLPGNKRPFLPLVHSVPFHRCVLASQSSFAEAVPAASSPHTPSWLLRLRWVAEDLGSISVLAPMPGWAKSFAQHSSHRPAQVHSPHDFASCCVLLGGDLVSSRSATSTGGRRMTAHLVALPIGPPPPGAPVINCCCTKYELHSGHSLP